MALDRIVLRLRPSSVAGFYLNPIDSFTKVYSQEWQDLLNRFDGLNLEPRFTAVPPDVIKNLEIKARISADNSLTRYFVVSYPAEHDPRAIISALLQWPDVEEAFIEPTPTDPAVNQGNDPRFGLQGYLGPAPFGIDAVFAWTLPGGDGAGQHFIDVEQGWTFDHEDLREKGVQLIHGGIQASSRAHGTAVLGEVCAVDNQVGGVGIVPNIASVSAASTVGSSVGNAILASTAHLNNTLETTGIILIEQQFSNYNGWPLMIVEAAPDVFDAIRLATQLGNLVVEAAGNGGHDLDTYRVASGFPLRRGDSAFRDSGALVVGAASSSVPHTRLDFSNYGSRIDCYGWGQAVATSTSNDAGATDLYTTGFNGTSSASPIIAGAALAVQGMKTAGSDKTPFNPGTLRAILSDRALGSSSSNPAIDRIGVMPNLRRIAGSVLKAAPELYIRDTLADTGLPHGGISSASPDIIVRNASIPNPQQSFGEGSGTESNALLSDTVKAGSDNFGYIRVRNRSSVPAVGAVATLYWAHPSTLVTPKRWNMIGSRTIDVPADDKLTVAGPFPWPKTNVPGAGHYCFIATITHSYDLAPDLSTLDLIQNFSTFIQVNNNVAWRNFNVADIRYEGISESRELPFFVPNPEPGPFTNMTVEVWAALPYGARLWIQMPDYVQPSPGLKVSSGTTSGTIKLEINPQGMSKPLAAQVLPNETALVLQAQVPTKFWANGPFEIYARQLYNDIEVGRITWLLTLPPEDHSR